MDVLGVEPGQDGLGHQIQVRLLESCTGDEYHCFEGERFREEAMGEVEEWRENEEEEGA